jgi:hypothetical protein
MNREQRLVWGEVRAKGKLRYVLMRGVLIHGGGLTLGSILVGLLLTGHMPTLNSVLVSGPVFFIIGALSGLGMWYRKEDDYHNSK